MSVGVYIAKLSCKLTSNFSCSCGSETAPSAPPTEVAAYNTSSTSLRVTWKEPPKDQQNGEIIAYTIYYPSAQSTGKSPPTFTVESSSLEANITGLSPFKDYLVNVSSSTSVGEGPKSAQVIIKTTEASKSRN